MDIIKLAVGDTVKLKKQHPCGNDIFKLLRVGSDVRIECTQCGRDLEMDRVKLEKAIKKIL